METGPTPSFSKKKKERELLDHERIALMGMMLGMAVNGQLPHGAKKKLGEKFRVAPRTVARLWKTSSQSRAEGMVVLKEVLSKKNNRGRKLKWDRQEMVEAVKATPLADRMTERDLAAEIDVPKSTVHTILANEPTLRRKKVYLKPTLNEEQKLARVDYCLEHEDRNSPGFFVNMTDRVHVDEKWFHMMRDGNCYILAEDEPDPEHFCRHKSYIGKVMFLSAVARPRYLPDGTFFDGKIGIWPFGRIKLAVNNSCNRPAGTPEWESFTCNSDTYRQYLISYVLPAIIDKFPSMYVFGDGRREVIIQQDGAGSHIHQNDTEFKEACEELGISVRLMTQPAQSPDLNINDLAFFASMASLMKKRKPKTQLQLVEFVQQEYAQYCPTVLNKMWLTHMAVMNEILKCDGGNTYKLPHLKKDQLARQGRLPTRLRITADSYAVRTNTRQNLPATAT